MEEATWEREDTIHANYPFFIRGGRYIFSHVILNDCSICMCLYVYVCVNFRDEIIFGGGGGGGECKTWKKSNFCEKWKNSKLFL